MNAEIIAVGSELLTAGRMDTNSLWLTAKLNELGVEVAAKSVVGDDRARLAAHFQNALARSDIVLLTGGLGPTEDDVTRDAVAGALGREMVFHQEICDSIEERFHRMGRRMADNNRRQAFVIDGATVMPNSRGTAPGLYLAIDGGKAVALLPGPPRELQPMFDEQCLPLLRQLTPPLVIRTRWYRVAGMPESDLDQLIAPVYTRYSNPVTTILAKPGDIEIHLRARCESAEEAEALLGEVAPRIEELLGHSIYSRDGRPIEAVIGEALRERGESLSVAESCTGGGLAARITSVPGSSDYFTGGFLTYSDAAKSAMLGVSEELIARCGAVSAEVAAAMAAGARSRTESTYALSVTGYAGPGGGTAENPAGTVFIGLASPAGASARRFRFLGERDRVRALAAQSALDMLRRRLAGIE